MKVDPVSRAPVEHIGRSLWVRIGGRLRARRTHLGLTKNAVAQELGIERRAYAAYESGVEQTPALLLTFIAELFGVPVFWFFQDIVFEEKHGQTAPCRPRGVYRVTTVEERINSLADSFRRLDLEGQQHLLAIAGALAQTGRKSA